MNRAKGKVSSRIVDALAPVALVLGISALAGCGGSSAVPEPTQVPLASASSSSEISATAQASSSGAAAEETQPQPAVPEASEVAAEETQPQPAAPETTEASEAAAATPTFNQEDYRAADTGDGRARYEFDALDLECHLDADGASCWRVPVEFTQFSFEGATVGEKYGYRFEAIPEVDPANIFTEKTDLPVGESITVGPTTCTNTGAVVRCDASGGYWFEMNATTIAPTPENLKNR
ncbi:hypothetical protein ACFP6B_11390 [Rothia nasimurium]|uniref:hypothetical protein n=1 Tax=Rothia nasimurium TaxID=85336 RepID=UPI00361135C7